jgi:hypothetical protein
MKMPTCFNTAHRIPRNNVTYAFGDLQVAMWANPRLVILGIGANARLRCVFNATL